MSTLIPCDYWNGTQTVDLCIPWITPESIYYLDNFFEANKDRDTTVLEFGSGGSTLYFAKRATYVLSFETLWPWYLRIKEIVFKSYPNVDLHFVENIDQIITIIEDKKFNLSLVDICNISRPELCKLSLSHLHPGSLLVLDNYSADYCEGMDPIFQSMQQKPFDDSHWAGSGTKIYHI